MKINRPCGRGIIAVANQKLSTEGVEAYKKELDKEYFRPEDIKELLDETELIKALNNNEYCAGALRTIKYIKESLGL